MTKAALQDDSSPPSAPASYSQADWTVEQGGQYSERRPMASVSSSSRRGTLLVVDDEPSICSSLKRVFSREYFVTIATNSAGALDLFRCGERFDVVLCDLMMPEVNGVELFLAVRRVAYDQSTRFVFMSGASLTAPMSAFLASVPNGFVAKPFDMASLTMLVRERVG